MLAHSNNIDFAAITEQQRSTWSLGDFNVIAMQVVPVSEALCNALDVHAGERTLDVACGSGNAALVAARRYAEVTGIDFVPSLIERAKQRAAADGTRVDFRVADAQALPFEDGSFDIVMSVFGVMFAPDQEQAASELLRVSRPGGRIGLACWMPQDFGGDFFRAHAKHAPPPPGLKPAVRWGTEEGIRDLLGRGVSELRLDERRFNQYYHSTDHALEVFRQWFGPTKRAFERVGAAEQDALRKDLVAVLERYNRATDGTLVLESKYMQIVATRD